MTTPNVSVDTTDKEWAREGTQYHMRSRADKAPKLPGGIYRYGVTPFGAWFLEREADQFTFPFKVYPVGDNSIERITKHWALNPGNLGVLFNGTRGAGKTMNAQMLANRLIRDKQIPVVVVRSPIPLQLVLDAVRQDMMVIFDEFEKSHDKDAQQELLSTVDGMSRNAFKRLFLFTTNVSDINENFRDRPSRIHYQFEYSKCSDMVIEGLIEDGLPKHLHKFKPDILSYLATRSLCTIDIVKAVLAEVRIFEESPVDFEEMLNISKGEPPSYKISILNPETNLVEKEFREYFKIHSNYEKHAPLMADNKRAVMEFVENGKPVDIWSDNWNGHYALHLVEKCPEPGVWLAELGVPKSATPYADYSQLYDNGCPLFMDAVRPKDWHIPSKESLKDDPEDKKLEELENRYEQSTETATVYGTGKRGVFKIRIQENHVKVQRQTYTPDRFTYGD